jgi:Calpain family cysteine protease
MSITMDTNDTAAARIGDMLIPDPDDKTIEDAKRGFLQATSQSGIASATSPSGIASATSQSGIASATSSPVGLPPISQQLNDPTIEPQFNVPGINASMGTPKNVTPVPDNVSGINASMGAPKYVNLFPEGEPDAKDIDQHAIGDCYLDAALADMAQQDPEFVKNMVHDNGDGTYTVHLFTPHGQPVDVTVDSKVPIDSNGNSVSVTGPNGQVNWASIVEKAFVKYNDVYHVVGSPDSSGYAPLEGGDYNENFYESLTGVSTETFDNSKYSTPAEQSDFAQTMQQDILSGRTIFANVTPGQTMPDGTQIVGTHVYSVLDVNQDANGNWYVDVRNPWGFTPGQTNSNSTTDDGVIRMSISDYLKYTTATIIGDKPIETEGSNIAPPAGINIPPPPPVPVAHSTPPLSQQGGNNPHLIS